LRLDVAPETLRRAVPPMLLQTLVENAVKYGIAPRPEGGEISIVARLVDGNLDIEVRNPGSIVRMHKSVTGAVSEKRSTQVGLRNALDRLQLLFGDSASLQLVQSAADEVTAKVRVPQSLDFTVGASDVVPVRDKNLRSVSV
jgi:sensor histidine kinase YesM